MEDIVDLGSAERVTRDALLSLGWTPPGQDRLDKIVQLQKEFQEVILGHGNLTRMHLTDRAADYFRTQALALVVELGEASNEIGWKPWATSRHIHHKRYRSELIDAFHFLLNLMLLDDMTADEIYEGYLEKQATNRRRQVEGYDGVTGKCGGCGRAYDDDGVKCTEDRCEVVQPQHCPNCHAKYGDPGVKCRLLSVSAPGKAWCSTKQTEVPV